MITAKRILVAGAGGFIGNHLVATLKQQDNWVRGADIKYAEHEKSSADDFLKVDLRDTDSCMENEREQTESIRAIG